MVTLVDKSVDLIKNLRQKQEVKRLKEKIGQLKPEYQEMILLRIIDGLSVREVAHITGKSEGNVRVITHRALAKLRKLYEQQK